ncbi:ceramidase domain-containing protein [Celeribacter sp. PS-C1]|uniref:ceramidase domain-containing protein n=1 Tax=Celeribacter sp. PS-C1 TaxID=2820813 RepID=UPI001C6630DC|nr:ceramidase domain-containing protein [Celeribacter sp. PS-C1]MBW6416631.1 ceramidase [Celeribacter sp. PS-C1]
MWPETWNAQIDAYCERTDFTFWSEPVNALTNAAFLIAALVIWPRARAYPMARALVVVLFVIGLGSFAFHTTATRWGAMVDTLPILLFILLYIFAATRDYFGLETWKSVLVTMLFFPYAAATVPLFSNLGLGSSAAYAPVPMLIFIYAILLRRRAPLTARGLAVGALILCLSIAMRWLDEPICAGLPLGTHFLWHILNAMMLGWMIHVYLTHMLEGRAQGR